MRGSITVSACLMLASVILLNTVLLDYVRINASRAELLQRMKIASDSFLAGYDALLYQKYGLYGRNLGNGQDKNEIFCSYLSHGASLPAIETIETKGGLHRPEALCNQITALMKYRTPANLALELLERLDLLAEGGRTGEEYRLCGEIAACISKAYDLRNEIAVLTEGQYRLDWSCINGYKRSDSVRKELTALNMYAEQITMASHVDVAAAAGLLQALNTLHTFTEFYIDYYNRTLQKTAILHSTVTEARRLTARLKDLLAETDRSSGETYAAQQLAEFEHQLTALGQTASQDVLRENLALLQTIRDLSGLLIACLSEYPIPVQAAALTGQMAEQISECDSRIQAEVKIAVIHDQNRQTGYEQYDPRDETEEHLKDRADTTVGKEINSLLYQTLPSQEHANTVSTAQWEHAVSFDDFAFASGLLHESESLADSAAERILEVGTFILIDDYIMTYMTHRLDARPGMYFQQEVEYILCGNRREKDNQDAVRNRLFAVRFLLNTAHILRDHNKMSFAEAIGNSIAGVFSFGLAGPLFTVLVIAAWSAAESISDLKLLFDGKTVPIVKNRHDWKTDLKGMAEFIGQDTEEENPQNSVTALDYEGYLRLLLALMPQETKLLRIADLIEVNFTNEYGQRYRLCTVFTSFRVQCSIAVPLICTFFTDNQYKRIREVYETAY